MTTRVKPTTRTNPPARHIATLRQDTTRALGPQTLTGPLLKPQPSLTSKTPPNTAERKAGLRPERIWRKPPVKAPAMMALKGSSWDSQEAAGDVMLGCGYLLNIDICGINVQGRLRLSPSRNRQGAAGGAMLVAASLRRNTATRSLQHTCTHGQAGTHKPAETPAPKKY